MTINGVTVNASCKGMFADHFERFRDVTSEDGTRVSHLRDYYVYLPPYIYYKRHHNDLQYSYRGDEWGITLPDTNVIKEKVLFNDDGTVSFSE